MYYLKCHFGRPVVDLKAVEVNWFPFTYILVNLITNSIYAWLTKNYRSSGMILISNNCDDANKLCMWIVDEYVDLVYAVQINAVRLKVGLHKQLCVDQAKHGWNYWVVGTSHMFARCWIGYRGTMCVWSSAMIDTLSLRAVFTRFAAFACLYVLTVFEKVVGNQELLHTVQTGSRGSCDRRIVHQQLTRRQIHNIGYLYSIVCSIELMDSSSICLMELGRTPLTHNAQFCHSQSDHLLTLYGPLQPQLIYSHCT